MAWCRVRVPASRGRAKVAELLESIPTDSMVGLRDRALIGLMAYQPVDEVAEG